MPQGSALGGSQQIVAPAKINLHLRVGPRRDDGFHPLLTWMATIDLCDTLRMDEGEAAAPIRLNCSDPTLPVDDRNLVMRAAKLLRERITTESATGGIADSAAGDLGKAPRSPVPRGRPVSLHLEKRVPAGGGLGGGSSDAAAALVGLNRFWDVGLDGAQLAELAARLGSDVPFFLFGPSSVCRGRGEDVQPIGPAASTMWVTLVLPPIGMPTADVYRQFDQMQLGREADVVHAPDWGRWLTLGANELLPHLVNDLEPPAFALRPELSDLRANLEQSLGRPVRMSGSGSSLFTLYDDRDEAQAAAESASCAGARALAVRLFFPIQPAL